MSFEEDIAQTRIRIGRVVGKNRLGQMINDRILDRLLKHLDKEIKKVSLVIGQVIVTRLKENILSSNPTGHVYEVVRVTDVGDKNVYEVIGTYQASAPGQPPNSIKKGGGMPPTGTLVDAISFEIEDDGRIKVGVFNSPGTEYESMSYFGGKIFISSDPSKNQQTSVVDYANFLDKGGSYSTGYDVEARPWFTDVLNDMRPVIREMVQGALKQARDSYSRNKYRNKIYFRTYFKDLDLRSSEMGDYLE